MPRFLFLPDTDTFTAATRVRWQLTRPHGETTGDCALADVPHEPGVIAVLPLTRIAFIDALLPPVSAQKRNELLAFAIEDKLTIDPATIHAVVLGPSLSGANRHVVAAVDKRWLADALEAIGSAGLRVTQAVAASALQTPAPGSWRASFDATDGMAVRPDGLAFVLDALDANDKGAPFALKLALNEARAAGASAVPHRIDVAASVAINAEAWRMALDVPVAEINASSVAASNDIARANLLTGAFAHRDTTAWRAALRPALWLCAALIALQVLFVSLDAWRLQHERTRLEAAMKSTFQTAFPQATTIVDARLQMTRNLADLKRERGMGDDAVLVTLAALATFAHTSANAMPGMAQKIRSIGFNGQSVELQVDADLKSLSIDSIPGASASTKDGKTVLSIPVGGVR